MAAQRGQTLAQMALGWVLNDENITSVLIGASSPEQIAQNVAVIGQPGFTENELAEINKISLGHIVEI